jgi:hypothetical protein
MRVTLLLRARSLLLLGLRLLGPLLLLVLVVLLAVLVLLWLLLVLVLPLPLLPAAACSPPQGPARVVAMRGLGSGGSRTQHVLLSRTAIARQGAPSRPPSRLRARARAGSDRASDAPRVDLLLGRPRRGGYQRQQPRQTQLAGSHSFSGSPVEVGNRDGTPAAQRLRRGPQGSRAARAKPGLSRRV